MALREGTTIDRGYVTVAGDDGVNYREIAETMTELGHPMNHSSARNHVIRIMRRFVDAIAAEYDITIPDGRTDEIAKSPSFQQAMAELLQAVESERREQRDAAIVTPGGTDGLHQECPEAHTRGAAGAQGHGPADIHG